MLSFLHIIFTSIEMNTIQLLKLLSGFIPLMGAKWGGAQVPVYVRGGQRTSKENQFALNVNNAGSKMELRLSALSHFSSL